MKRLFLIAAFFCLYSFSAYADFPGLRSLETIYVEVPTLNEDAKRIGLDDKGIRARVENQLQDAGFHLGSAEKSYPRLEITVTAMKPFAGYVVSYKLRIVDWVQAKRNENLSFTATVWDQSSMFSSTKKEAQKKFDPALTKMVENFIADFRKENPLF